jgi:hypothetical protein
VLAFELFCEARRDRNLSLSFATGGMLLGFLAKTAYESVAGATILVDQQEVASCHSYGTMLPARR